jgi:uncharacterized protein (UPF0218 family)
MYRLPVEMRETLARPIGRLFLSTEIRGPLFAKVVKSAPTLVSVGDRVTETIGGMGRPPDVQIVDGKENRKERSPPAVRHLSTIRVSNPPATITHAAIEGIKKAFERRKPVRVLVDGEEDLLAIPAVVLAPEGALVFYGQPGQGIVMIRVNAASRARNERLLGKMSLEKNG